MRASKVVWGDASRCQVGVQGRLHVPIQSGLPLETSTPTLLARLQGETYWP